MPANSEARFDLLGDPIPENRGRRGRPPHISTERNRYNIKLLLALWWTSTRIAQALRITRATLRKYYFRVGWRADSKLGGGHQIPTAALA